MTMGIRRMLCGRTPKAVREERERELRELKAKIRDTIHTVKIRNRMLATIALRHVGRHPS